jgi:hypothetical protein
MFFSYALSLLSCVSFCAILVGGGLNYLAVVIDKAVIINVALSIKHVVFLGERETFDNM